MTRPDEVLAPCVRLVQSHYDAKRIYAEVALAEDAPEAAELVAAEFHYYRGTWYGSAALLPASLAHRQEAPIV